MLMQALKLACRVGGKELFRDPDLVVNDVARLGLVGHNGTGRERQLVGGAWDGIAGGLNAG